MTREEAIEVYNGLINTKIKEAFEFFAPELAESEDERHRKWILEYLYDGLRKADEQFKGQFNAAIAYLEKQKEKSGKPIIPEKENEVMEAIEGAIRVYGKTQGEWIAGYDMDTLVVHLRKAFAALEKQKETLHISETCKENANSFTDEDESIRKKIVSAICYFRNDGCISEDEFAVCRSWLEKQKEPHYTKRNALFDKCVANCDPEIMKEVSDEIDSQLKKEQKLDDNQFPPLDGLDAIKAQYYDRGFKNGFDEGVDSVKPAEWREEDEKVWQDIFDLCNRFGYDDACRKLKSLRPHWKPSEVCYGAKGDPDPAGVWKPSEEQPQVADASKMEQPEVDLEKEIDKGIADYSFTKTIDSGGFKTTVIDYAKIARHFFELGLKARKEE